MKINLNLNTILGVLGGLSVFAPDVAGASAWLSSMHVGWLTYVARGLGILALFFTAAPRVVPRLRAFLAVMGLATAPGTVAPGAQSTSIPAGDVTNLPVSKGPAVLALLVLGTALLLGGTAQAQSYGGCFASGRLCAGPSASITVVSFNLADSTFSGGVSPGVGYGVTFTPPSAPWAAVGLDLYASVRLGQGAPNTATFSIMGHFASYVFLGVGPSITQEPAGVPALVQWSILGGFGVPIDLGAYRARAEKGD